MKNSITYLADEKQIVEAQQPYMLYLINLRNCLSFQVDIRLKNGNMIN